MRIALVEDDVHVGQLMSLWLEEDGFQYQLYLTGKAFLKAMGRESFDVIILDWMLPDINGDALLAWVRKHVDWPVPVVFVTARDSEQDIVNGLNLGADDYITKPVRRGEFVARINAVARRAGVSAAGDRQVLELPPYRVDTASRTIAIAGKPVELTQKEFEVANFLFHNVGRLLSRGHILESVWGKAAELHTRTVDTHMSRLRSKLGFETASGWKLTAVYNHGYRLEHVVSVAEPGDGANA